eukprot:3940779-Rhodomonas_salina.1
MLVVAYPVLDFRIQDWSRVSKTGLRPGRGRALSLLPLPSSDSLPRARARLRDGLDCNACLLEDESVCFLVFLVHETPGANVAVLPNVGRREDDEALVLIRGEPVRGITADHLLAALTKAPVGVA